MPIKVGFEHIVRNRIICNRNMCIVVYSFLIEMA